MSDRKQTIRDRRHEKDLSKIPTLSECISRARNGVTSLKKNKKRLVAKKRCRKFMSSMKKSLRLKSVEKFAAKVGILPTNSIHQQSNDNNSKTSLTKLKSKLFLGRKNMAPFQSDIRPSAWLRKNQTSISRTIVSSICTSSIVALCGGGTIIGTGIAYAAGATLSVAISDAMLSPSKNNRNSAQPKKRKNNHSDNKQEEQDKAIKRARNCELSPNFQRKMTSKHVRN